MNKQFLIAAVVVAVMATAASAYAEDVKLGIIVGFTGPIESLTPDMSAAAELAMKEASASGLFLGGSTITAVKADSTCIDASAATTAAERLVTADKVRGIVGGDCSGVTGAILQKVARPNGIVMISPSATSPALSTATDDGLFFRTAPSDARQGQIMAKIITNRGIKAVAVTYTNNDYGKGLADSFESAFETAGGKITINAAHEDGKADYSAEVGALASAGGEALVVAGYLDQGGLGIIQKSLDTDAFRTFVLPDGMIGESLVKAVGSDLNGSFGQHPGTDSPGAALVVKLGKENGFKGDSPFAPESYDAAALLILAMQAAGSSDPAAYKSKVMSVANAPGEEILPGELEKALRILRDGGEVDYVGGSAVELVGAGESQGNYREIEIKDGMIVTVRYF